MYVNSMLRAAAYPRTTREAVAHDPRCRQTWSVVSGMETRSQFWSKTRVLPEK